MTQDELAKLEKEVEERMDTSGNKNYNEIVSRTNDFNNPFEITDADERHSKMRNAIYLELKNKYSNEENNAFYERITNALPKITEMIQNKATELEELPIPNEPSFAQRMYSGISKNQNNADKAMIAYNNKVTQINNYIYRLKILKSYINTLLPIYAPLTAGKRKTRRNKNKKRKPIKKQQKSKRRR
jgi:hypothetical protein